MPSAFRSPASVLRFALTAMVGVGLDLWTKQLAFSKLCSGVVTFPDGQVRALQSDIYRFIPGWLSFEVTANRGAVFGWGQGWRMLFLAASAAASIFLVYLFARSGRRWFYQILLGMLLAGVLGNLYDRLCLGYVRDMIHALPRWPGLFPYIFNVADSLLCVGVGLMIIWSFHVPPKTAGDET